MEEMPAKSIATICDISLARVGQLAKEGVITKLPNGKYQPEAITEYIRYLREKNGGKATVSEELDREKLRRIKRENDLEEQLVAPVDKLTDALVKTFAVVCPILDNIPLLIKRYWPEVTGDQMQLVTKAIAECRNAIADAEINLDD